MQVMASLVDDIRLGTSKFPVFSDRIFFEKEPNLVPGSKEILVGLSRLFIRCKNANCMARIECVDLRGNLFAKPFHLVHRECVLNHKESVPLELLHLLAREGQRGQCVASRCSCHDAQTLLQ